MKRSYQVYKMSQVKIVAQLLMLLSLFHAKMLRVRNTYDPGSCSKSNHGELILVKDRENRDTILVCTEDKGIYSWKTTDNYKPPGGVFQPWLRLPRYFKQKHRSQRWILLGRF